MRAGRLPTGGVYPGGWGEANKRGRAVILPDTEAELSISWSSLRSPRRQGWEKQGREMPVGSLYPTLRDFVGATTYPHPKVFSQIRPRRSRSAAALFPHARDQSVASGVSGRKDMPKRSTDAYVQRSVRVATLAQQKGHPHGCPFSVTAAGVETLAPGVSLREAGEVDAPVLCPGIFSAARVEGHLLAVANGLDVCAPRPEAC